MQFAMRLAVICALLAPRIAAARDLELTFDDGPDGSGVADGRAELDNLDPKQGMLGVGKVDAWLTGNARRSALHDGRYGRAADFPGGAGGIEASPWTTKPNHGFSLWVRPRNDATGTILAHEASWDLHLVGGDLVFGAYRAPGEYVTFATGQRLPADGMFHHLAVILVADGNPRPTIAVDFGSPTAVSLPFRPQASSGPLRLGIGFDGLIDELVVDARVPGARDLFDFSPTFCASGTTCLEEVITTTPRTFPHEVPVRFKTAFDPARCSDAAPCPLVFEISGGSKCADDYGEPTDVSALAAAGFVVVTVDLYCEGDSDTMDFPHETSQLIAVKNYVMDQGPFKRRIAGPGYAATGCSHGAGTVHAWAMMETDYPARSFARSTGRGGLCNVYNDYLCPQVQAYRDQQAIENLGTTDLEDPRVQAIHEASDTLALITDEVVRTREVARSWGAAADGEAICDANGMPTCNEEGLWAMHFTSRRFRDLWERTQPADAPSGYFVEDHSSSCQHCAPSTSLAYACGVCMLKVGRQAMATACAHCLEYADQTISHGAEAESCSVPASWYSDPLAPPPDEPTGCGCSSGDLGGGVVVLLILAVWIVVRRTARRTR